MARVTDRYEEAGDRPVVICDFTPPRSGDPTALERLRVVKADFMCAAYNPGKLVRADSISVAYAVKERIGTDVAFNLATRDMNKIALASQLLGAQMLGLENVIALAGDDLAERELSLGVKQVRDLTPTGLIAAVRSLNEGQDYRGANLQAPTSFCLGATMDLGKGIEREAALAYQKVEAGAQFFITQPIYAVGDSARFLQSYQDAAGAALAVPVLWGVQVLDKDGMMLGELPEGVRRELDGGRPGWEIASELAADLAQAGVKGIYLVPPILKGGARDYEAAQRVIEAL